MSEGNDKVTLEQRLAESFASKDHEIAEAKEIYLKQGKSTVKLLQDVFVIHFVYAIASQKKFEMHNLPSKALCNHSKRVYNQSDLRLHVNFALYDAVAICNRIIAVTAVEHTLTSPPFELEVRAQSRMFSNMIDHDVVYDYKSNIPLFVVQSIMHLPSNDVDTEENQKLWRQLYDQLLEMKLAGNPTPFGALTSFNSTIIFWLDSANHKSVLAYHVREGLGGERIGEIICPDGAVSQSLQSDGRAIVVSANQFQQDCIVDVFINATFCSLDGVSHLSSIVKDLKVDMAVTLDHACCLKVSDSENEVKYEWDRVATIYKGPLSEQMYKNLDEGDRDLYLISCLGRGANTRSKSKVYRAITKRGYDCVVKMYVPHRAADHSLMTECQFDTFSDKLANEEFANFQKIYGETILNGYVWREKLNGIHCIIMPYFEPVEKDNRTSDEVRKAIVGQLNKFGNAGKEFHMCDQVWRHVGYFQDQIFLFDLGNLMDIDNYVEIDDMICNHMDCLTERA